MMFSLVKPALPTARKAAVLLEPGSRGWSSMLAFTMGVRSVTRGGVDALGCTKAVAARLE